MFGALKRGRFRSLTSLILVVNVVGELQRKRTLAASRGFLAAARLSCCDSHWLYLLTVFIVSHFILYPCTIAVRQYNTITFISGKAHMRSNLIVLLKKRVLWLYRRSSTYRTWAECSVCGSASLCWRLLNSVSLLLISSCWAYGVSPTLLAALSGISSHKLRHFTDD